MALAEDIVIEGLRGLPPSALSWVIGNSRDPSLVLAAEEMLKRANRTEDRIIALTPGFSGVPTLQEETTVPLPTENNIPPAQPVRNPEEERNAAIRELYEAAYADARAMGLPMDEAMRVGNIAVQSQAWASTMSIRQEGAEIRNQDGEKTLEDLGVMVPQPLPNEVEEAPEQDINYY